MTKSLSETLSVHQLGLAMINLHTTNLGWFGGMGVMGEWVHPRSPAMSFRWIISGMFWEFTKTPTQLVGSSRTTTPTQLCGGSTTLQQKSMGFSNTADRRHSPAGRWFCSVMEMVPVIGSRVRPISHRLHPDRLQTSCRLRWQSS